MSPEANIYPPRFYEAQSIVITNQEQASSVGHTMCQIKFKISLIEVTSRKSLKNSK